MKDIKNYLTSGKNTSNIQSRRGKSFGYQVLGFGSGGEAPVTPYIIATGGTITDSGDYRIHTFTGDGTFNVTNAGLPGPAGSTTVDYLVLAGGGGGGSDNAGGG